jgi:hypothetical protein
MNPRLFHLLRSLFAGLALFASLGGARAQTTATLSQDRVTFFTEPNFKGDALTVEAGASVDNLDQLRRPDQQPWTAAISSIRIEGAARATVFSNPGFGGERLEVSRSLPDLYAERRSGGGTWDRTIASLSVVSLAAPAPPPPAPVMTSPPPMVVQPQPPPVVVQQQSQVVVVPQPQAPVVVRREPPPTVVVVPQSPPPRPPVVIREVRPRLDRRTAEAMVQRAFRDVLNRPPDPEGLRLYRERLMNEGWSERQMVEQLQRSSEARGVNADAAITAAYREVLGRDPDANGLAHYRAKWRDGWTQGQIRDDLRRSGEGRDGYIRNVITRAYREVLGREPDPAGFATYERAMRERGYTEKDVRAALMSGDEYRQKHRRR